MEYQPIGPKWEIHSSTPAVGVFDIFQPDISNSIPIIKMYIFLSIHGTFTKIIHCTGHNI